jgi:hypothetical protein
MGAPASACVPGIQFLACQNGFLVSPHGFKFQLYGLIGEASFI